MSQNMTTYKQNKPFIQNSIIDIYDYKKEQDPVKNYFDFGINLIPDQFKQQKLSEDVAVITDRLLVVADGLGCWARNGIDPSIYPTHLCQNIANIYQFDSEKYKLNPQKILKKSIKDISELGSSTCVLVQLDEQKPILFTSNIGDSGFMILRQNQNQLSKIFKSQQQQHSFNRPYQVGYGGDDLVMADDWTHNVQNNDLIVLGSDGLWDNMYDQKIIEIIQKQLREGKGINCQNIANQLAEKAQKLSIDQDYASPFSEMAQQHFFDYIGGKPNDITVIVAQIQINSKFSK